MGVTAIACTLALVVAGIWEDAGVKHCGNIAGRLGCEFSANSGTFYLVIFAVVALGGAVLGDRGRMSGAAIACAAAFLLGVQALLFGLFGVVLLLVIVPFAGHTSWRGAKTIGLLRSPAGKAQT